MSANVSRSKAYRDGKSPVRLMANPGGSANVSRSKAYRDSCWNRLRNQRSPTCQLTSHAPRRIETLQNVRSGSFPSPTKLSANVSRSKAYRDTNAPGLSLPDRSSANVSRSKAYRDCQRELVHRMDDAVS